MYIHGATVGRGKTREYRAWALMKRRCYNKNHDKYKYYGGRGIRVCTRWQRSFSNFLADMGPCPPRKTLDRVDNERHYMPDNCRWATHSEQMKNRRPFHMTGHWLRLEGQRFGRLVVIEMTEIRDQETYFRCRCDCGGEKVTRGSSLKQGFTRSCGCLRREKSAARAKKFGALWAAQRKRRLDGSFV